MRLANKNDIECLAMIRINQQKDDWENEYIDKDNLLNRTKLYLENHLNKDFYAFIEEIDNNIVSTCCLQVIEYLPQCNDNGRQGYICNVYTKDEYRNNGIQTRLMEYVIDYAMEKKLCKLELSTDSDKAITIYKKCGFEFDSQTMKKKLYN